ncbi:MAG TPA: hypothetical protein VHA80_13230 [Solirubrobacterales bacterium]|nr:hypothetical protein [Solirubrobacterales bacterium]
MNVSRTRKLAIALLLASVASASPAAAASAPPVDGHWQGKTAQGLPIFFGVRAGSVVNVRWFADLGLCGRQEVRYPHAVILLGESGRFEETFEGEIRIEGTFASARRAHGEVIFPKTTGLPGCPPKTITFHAVPRR